MFLQNTWQLPRNVSLEESVAHHVMLLHLNADQNGHMHHNKCLQPHQQKVLLNSLVYNKVVINHQGHVPFEVDYRQNAHRICKTPLSDLC